MKVISPRRHRRALRKEIDFWRRIGIERQTFRTTRYTDLLRRSEQALGGGRVDRVLEVGCGPTFCASIIDARDTWFLDPLLDEYRHLPDVALPAGHLVPTTIEDVRLEPGSFDIAVALNVMDHVRDPWLALGVIRDALRPDGVFLLSVYTRGAVLAGLRNLQEWVGLSTDVAHPYSFTRVRMERDLARVGFGIEVRATIDASGERTEYAWLCRPVERRGLRPGTVRADTSHGPPSGAT